MSENNSFWSDYSENLKSNQKISNIKSTIKNVTNETPIKAHKKMIYKQDSNKSLLLVEKLSQNKNKIGRFRNALTNEELKLVNHSVNQTVDIDENVAYNLANTIVKRRFKYFGIKRNDDDYDIKKRLIELKKIEEERKRREKERREKEREEKERKEREEKERQEKLKKKELMKTVQINIEERNRRNHNYKIIKKLTKEVEILDNENNLEKYKDESQNDKYLLKSFKINPVEKSTKTLIVNKSRPQINTRQIKTPKRDDYNKNINININNNLFKIEVNKNTVIKQTKDILSLKNKIKSINIVNKELSPKKEVNYDKKIIMVNKIGDNRKNNEINKIFVQKNVIQKDIIAKKHDNYKAGENVRNKYKNKNNNKYI